MKQLCKPSVIYTLLALLTVSQVVSVIYTSAVGMSHTARYNVVTQEKAMLEERKLLLESSVAANQAIATIPEDVREAFYPISKTVTLSSPTSLALVQ